MKTIDSAKSFLDQQTDVAIWYAEYEDRCEAIRYANENFSQTFGISIDQIIERSRYHLVNPPETPSEIIEQYKNEDLEAIEQGCFLSCSPVEAGKNIVVVKLRFDQGVLGLFKIIDSQQTSPKITWQDLDEEIASILQQLQPGFFERRSSQ